MTDPEDVLADAWFHLVDECAEAVRVHHELINQLSRAGLLPSPTATALTASTDQLQARAAEIRRSRGTDHGVPG